MSAQNYCGAEYLHMTLYPFSQDCTDFSTPQAQQLGTCAFLAAGDFVQFLCPSGDQRAEGRQGPRNGDAQSKEVALRYPVIVPSQHKAKASPLLTLDTMRGLTQFVSGGFLEIAVPAVRVPHAVLRRLRAMPADGFALVDGSRVIPVQLPAGVISVELTEKEVRVRINVAGLRAHAGSSPTVTITYGTTNSRIEIADIRM
jgi:hypothetical protein